MRQGGQVSNLVPFAVDALPESLEQEPNSQQRRSQKVRTPVVVNGRIDQPGDIDVFRFEGRAGSEVVAEVHARRLGSPLDSVLRLVDIDGSLLASNDDRDDESQGLMTHHADSWLRATLPADGMYYLHLGDAQNKGGPEYAYRLRIGPSQGDFELRVVPSSIVARAGTTVPVTVYAMRKDGFADDITLSLTSAPDGFELGGGWIPANQDKVRVTLTVPPVPASEPLDLSMEGRAVIQGEPVVRPVVPADDMMQAFFYHHLVPAREWKVVVNGAARRATQVKVVGETPVKIPAGGTAGVRIAASANMYAGQVQLELSEPPEGITIGKVTSSREGVEAVLRCDGGVKPGLKGNLILSAFSMRASAPSGKAPQAANRRASLGVLPAIPFEVVAP